MGPTTTELADRVLAGLLVERQLLGPREVQAALGLSGPGQRLGAVLLRQGWIAPAALEALRQEPIAAGCAGCAGASTLTLAQLELGVVGCPACGGELTPRSASSGRRRPGWTPGALTPGSWSGSNSAKLTRPPPGPGPPLPPPGPADPEAMAGSGSARLVEPAGSGSSRFAPGVAGPGSGQACGPYQLLDELGAGGYGVVFRAWDPRHEREVAVKLLTSTSPRARERFAREIKATARLQHPNIVPLLDSGEQDGTLYLVMELVRGRTLADRSEGADRLPLEAAVRVVKDVARAIEYAHSQGVLHRDLKPHNVLVDPAGRPQVVDFGLAQLEDRQTQLTRTGASIGTPAYMPPEQARSDGTADATSDVYALGATLYHALTGRPPFAGMSGAEMLLAIFRQDPAPPSAQDRRVPVDLDTVCLKCLEKSPQRRYASAGELAQDLERWLRGDPITARPLSPLRRLGRRARAWAARHRKRALGGLVTLLLLVVGTALLLGEWSLRRREEALEAELAGRRQVEAREALAREAEAKERSRLRVEECRRALQTAQERPLETDADQVVARVSREADPAVEALLIEGVERVAKELARIERELYLEAAQPDPDERLAGIRPLDGLAAALDAREALAPGAPLPPAAAAVVAEAEERLKRRVYRRLNPEARRTPPRILDLLGSRQETSLGQGRLLAGRIACEALGRLGSREAVRPLTACLLHEGDALRALWSAKALARLDDPAVEPALRAALVRFGESGLLAEQVRAELDRRAKRR